METQTQLTRTQIKYEYYDNKKKHKYITGFIIMIILICSRPAAGIMKSGIDSSSAHFKERNEAVLSYIICKISLNKDKNNVFFNGVALEDAVRSNVNIDNFTQQIINVADADVISRISTICNWIDVNIRYSNSNVKNSVANSDNDVGAVYTFENRTGSCFDYAALFIAICKAADIRCRLVTGLAFTGAEWISHAWNSYYFPEEKRWINIDPLFGMNEYFIGRNKFKENHIYPVIQGEW